MSCKCNCDKELASLKGTLSTPVLFKKITVESRTEPNVTYASGLQTVTITYEKEGYDCYLINCPQYGIASNFFVYIETVTPNQATLLIRNEGAAITGSIGTTLWLCVPEQ